MIFTIIILFIQIMSLFLTGFLWTALLTGLEIGSIIVFVVVMSVMFSGLAGFLLALINRKLFSIKMWKCILNIVLCSFLILFSFFLAVGESSIFDSVSSFFQHLWILVFHAKHDPLGILVLGFINLPIMFFVVPISFYIGDCLLKKMRKV